MRKKQPTTTFSGKGGRRKARQAGNEDEDMKPTRDEPRRG